MIEEGADKGKVLTVPSGGARVGRSSKNDFVIVDPKLSRHHCRLFFRANEGLFITDLGSANQTLVNAAPIQEARLKPGDTITLGDTRIKVLHDQPGAAGEPVVDLGFAMPAGPARKARRLGIGPLLAIAVVAAVAAMLAWLPRLLEAPEPAPVLQPAAAPPQRLEILYEKVDADENNIFRYQLEVTADELLRIQIDDIENDRKVRESKPVDSELLLSLGRSIADAGFFDLDGEYEGFQPGIYQLYDLSVTFGNQTHRCRVLNRPEPEVFTRVRERIEAFGKNELGLWAIQFSRERLLEMAEEAYLLGKKLFDEREIDYGNLFASIRSHSDAEWYLQTIEPKPDYYAELVAHIADGKRLLQEEFEERSFRAKRAMRTGDWDEAARELRVILEMIPDRADPRNEEARKDLLYAEQHVAPRR